MAQFKLVNTDVLDANLVALAKAIRTKSGGTKKLHFPEDFISEVEKIENGGSVVDGNLLSITNKATFCTAGLSFSETSRNYISLSSGRGVCKTLPEGNEYISAEVYYNCKNPEGTGYLLSMGSLRQRQTFSFTPSKFVGYDDDHAFSNSYPGKHHMVVTYDKGTTVKIYVDGVLRDNFTLGGTLNIVQTYFNQGSWMETDYECYEGDIFYTRVYKNILLSADEIQILYAHREDFVNGL